jgi:putative Ca2+/H+ antiporter (TMEM165/GDT1 family)
MSLDLHTLLYVFGVIFVAELPDKTALAALVMATRHKALPTFLGSASALTVQSVVAIAAGGLLSMLPARPVHVGAGILFIVSAAFMWRRGSHAHEHEHEHEHGDQGEAKPKGAPSFWGSFASVFGVIFVAEWGDLTQLGTAALAARFKQPVTVFVGATLALWCVSAIAVFIGHRAAKVLRPDITARIAAVLFAGVGVALVAGWI